MSEDLRPKGEPTLTDTIYASKMAAFLKANPDVAKWLCELFATPEGRQQLEMLIQIELDHAG